MIFRRIMALATVVIVCLAGASLYLMHERTGDNTDWWNSAIQFDQESLRRVSALEAMLEQGQLSEARLELRRQRLRSLTSLAGKLAQQLRPNSDNYAYALREFCAEAPIELLEPRNGAEQVAVEIVAATESLCEAG